MNLASHVPPSASAWSAAHGVGAHGPLMQSPAPQRPAGHAMPPQGRPPQGPPQGGPPLGPPPQGPPSYGVGPGPQGAAFPQPPRRTSRFSRLPSGAEVLGWGGGLTTLIGVAAVTWDFWSALSGLALIALLLVATAVLGVAAAVVGDLDRGHDDQLAANLSVGLWWMTGIAASFSIYVTTDAVSGGRAYLPLLAAAGAATAMFAALAHRNRRDSALTGAIISAAITAFAGASLASIAAPDRGLAVWFVAVLAVIGLAQYPQDRSRIAHASALTLLAGAAQAVILGAGAAVAVSLVLVGTACAAGVAVWQRSRGEGIAAAAVAGLVACQVLYDLAPQVFSLSTTILLTGIAMTVGCIHLVRRSTRNGA